MKTKVVNIKSQCQYDIYIGRPSKWGNPFIIGKNGTRDEVIEKYKEYLLDRPDLLKQISTLYGKILGCYCKPQQCHGDILAEIADFVGENQWE